MIETGLQGNTLEACYNAWARFFASDEKLDFARRGGALDGYFPIGSERAIGARDADPKEFFHAFADGPWPNTCASLSAALFDALSQAAAGVLATLPEIRDSDFAQQITASPHLVLRIARYASATRAAAFAHAHTDVNLVTVLPPPTCAGLDLRDPIDGWIGAPELAANQALVLVGDMLEEATGGAYLACRHRVHRGPDERLSFSFFTNPDEQTRLSSRFTAGELLDRRLREIGLRHVFDPRNDRARETP